MHFLKVTYISACGLQLSQSTNFSTNDNFFNFKLFHIVSAFCPPLLKRINKECSQRVLRLVYYKIYMF
jgi:hypothetical protein